MSNSGSPRIVLQSGKAHARDLRKHLTPAETVLWSLLRDRRLSQTKWRRQFPVGPYIADFVCLEHRLVVECDGSQHADDPRDAVRDAWLAAQGFRVLRFWNHDVPKQRESVLETILAACGLPF